MQGCDTPGSGGVPNPAIPYSGSQPGKIAAGASKSVTINNQWNGRIFNQNGNCGSKGEGCTVLEYNLDTGSQLTAQAYDISNVQGFTQSVSIGADGCESTTCQAVNCPCTQAYPPGDTSGCGNDSPVRACGAGNTGFKAPGALTTNSHEPGGRNACAKFCPNEDSACYL